MVPLQAAYHFVSEIGIKRRTSLALTKFFLDHLEDLLLIKFLRKSLHSGQGFTTIAFCMQSHQSCPILLPEPRPCKDDVDDHVR